MKKTMNKEKFFNYKDKNNNRKSNDKQEIKMKREGRDWGKMKMLEKTWEFYLFFEVDAQLAS